MTFPGGKGPNLIVDDGGDATLMIHKGFALEKEPELLKEEPETADERALMKQLREAYVEVPSHWQKVVAGWKEDRLTKVYECEDHVMELLPPTQGCLFGSYEIDQWYKDDVANTITILEDLLSENTYEDRANGIYGGDFYYQASW